MANRLGLAALLVGALASSCGGEGELKSKLREAYVFVKFDEDGYCGEGENFNGWEGNLYQFVAADNLVAHNYIGSGNCGNTEVEKIDILYVNQFLGKVSCENIKRADQQGKLLMEGLYDPEFRELWASRIMQLDPEIKTLWSSDKN